jgi:hypothetical protein
MPRPSDPKLERWKYWGILGLVFIVGGVCAAPFGIAIFRLLDTSGGWLHLDPFFVALRAALAVTFAGVMLCILLLFYRLRNDDNSPSLTSGLMVVALGVTLIALVVFAMRGQSGPTKATFDGHKARLDLRLDVNAAPPAPSVVP